jgi:DNA-binding Xre family transcriptional regulator
MLRLRIKEVAQQQKISMNMLSHRSEVAYNVIKDCYRNPYRAMSTETINKIARALNVPATDLLEDVSEEFMKKEIEKKKAGDDT